jgi:hypothetical protein
MSDGKGVMSSTTDADFPRLEYTLAKGPHYLGLLGGAAIAAYLILMAVEAVAHHGPWSSSGGRLVSGAVLFSIALGVGLKLISRIDFEKVMLIVDRDGVWVARPRGTTSPHGAATTIPWSIISKIQYYEIGRLKQTKMIAIDLREIGEVRIDANLLRCGSSRELYETMRRYRRHFAPEAESDLPANRQVYQSASWTGLDDE